MSILIKGINPPSCCKSCQLIAWNNDAGFYCAVLSDNLVKCACSMDGSKRGDCPLVEIPEPHGRLIDADETKRVFGDYFEKVKVSRRYAESLVKNAIPTVIESEE